MLNIDINKESNTSIYIQIFEQISKKIIDGILRDRYRLPSQRELAKHLGVSVNTVVNAYNMLLQYEYIFSVSKSGYYVNGVKSKKSFYEVNWKKDIPYIYNFSKNGADLTMKDDFKRELRQAARELTEKGFGYPDYTGSYELRKQICLLLGKYYKIECQPTQVIIGTDVNSLIDSLIKVIGTDKTYGIENPSHYKLNDLIRVSGYKMSYLNVGLDGIPKKELENFEADVLITMPYHHYPLGSVLNLEQKEALLNWAGKNRYIVEWGYDIEFGALNKNTMFQMTDNKNVIFINDFTKTVSPNINIAYLILPEPLVRRWQENYRSFRSYSSAFNQIFIANIIKNGSFYKNLKRLEKLYRAKESCLIEAINKHHIGEKINIINKGFGTFLLIQPKTCCNEDTLLNQCHKVGVKISCIKNYLKQPNPHIPQRIYVLGYGELNEKDIEEGIKLLLDTWSETINNI